MTPRHRLRAFLLAFLAAATCAVTTATSANASARWPALPRSVHVTSLGTTAFTVDAGRSANVAQYKVFVSTVKNDLYASSLGSYRKNRTARASKRPHLVVAGLHYAAKPYFFRFATVNGPHMRLDTVRAVNLRPSTPSSVRVSNSSAGLSLTWGSGAATGFLVTQSTDAAMRQNRQTYSLRRLNSQFSPPAVSRGHRYYFRVRALNGSTPSTWSAQVAASPVVNRQFVRVVQYNVLADGFDGKRTTGEVIAPWSKRGPAAAALVRRVNPDVAALEEASSYAYGKRGARQVDTFARGLGSNYAVAPTEIVPWSKSYKGFRSGDYIVYRKTSWTPVSGRSGTWTLPGGKLYVAFSLLQSRSTGARFLMVATHLQAGAGSSYDALRKRQAQAVVSGAVSRAKGLPIVYSGDFNGYYSDYHPNDVTAQVMRANHDAESFFVAPKLVNSAYNSNNLYHRVAPRGLGAIDRIFADAGVSVRQWTQLLHLSHGRFVGVIPSDHNPVVADLGVPI